MKNGIAFALAICLCFASISSALALSESQYEHFMQTSSAFAKADKRLRAVWKRVTATVPRTYSAAALREQKKWSDRRDAEAWALHAGLDGKLALASCYALAANRRADELERRYVNSRPPQPLQEPNDFTGKWVLVLPKNDWRRTSSTDKRPSESMPWGHSGEITVSEQSAVSFHFEYHGAVGTHTGEIEDMATIKSSNKATFTQEKCLGGAYPDNENNKGSIHFELFNNILKITTENESCLGFGMRAYIDGTYMR